jgi:hypothetical protein
MQRKQQVGECWVCVIFFARLDLVFVLHSGVLHGGVGGGGFGGSAPEKKIFFFLHLFLVAVFRHMVFANGFLILVKELGLLTNLGQWIRGFGCCGILYMYCIVNNEDMMNRILEVWL